MSITNVLTDLFGFRRVCALTIVGLATRLRINDITLNSDAMIP